MKVRYQKIMEGLYLACIVLSAAAVVLMTAVIPYGVVMRYLVLSPQGWPEPLSVLLMIVFTFIGGAGVPVVPAAAPNDTPTPPVCSPPTNRHPRKQATESPGPIAPAHSIG